MMRYGSRRSLADLKETPRDLGLHAYFHARARVMAKARPTLKEGLRIISFAQVRARMMFVMLKDENKRRSNYGKIESEKSRTSS